MAVGLPVLQRKAEISARGCFLWAECVVGTLFRPGVSGSSCGNTPLACHATERVSAALRESERLLDPSCSQDETRGPQRRGNR